jgi:hypothetical protein
MDVADLFVTLTISNQAVSYFWIYHCECKQGSWEWVLAGVLIVNVWHPPNPHKPWTRDLMSDSAILSRSSPYFLHVSSLFFIWHVWQVEHKQSMFNILYNTRPCHVMVFLIVFSVLVCSGLRKYSWYQESTLCCLSRWLRNLDLFFVTKKIIPFNMLHWVMRLD